jgi:hypothetical protein
MRQHGFINCFDISIKTIVYRTNHNGALMILQENMDRENGT